MRRMLYDQAAVRVSYLAAESVAELVSAKLSAASASSSSSSAHKVVVVDVREPDEYDDGHIIGAVHRPSELWKDKAFVADFLIEHLAYDQIVFHCQKSQIRGPTCAKICAALVGERVELGDLSYESAPLIQILRGGFQEFEDKFSDRSDLIETSTTP